MNKSEIIPRSSQQLLTEMIIDVEIKLLQENLLGKLYDDFLYRNKAMDNRDAAQKELDQQRRNEKERYLYIKSGYPITNEPKHQHLKKASLRKYYEKNNFDVPEPLQGKEHDHSGFEQLRSGDAGVDKMVSAFADQVNLHPSKEKKIKDAIKATGGGIAAAGSFLGNLYKKITGTDFIPKGKPTQAASKAAPGQTTTTPTSGSQSTSPQGGSPSQQQSAFSSYTSTLVAGLPGNTMMFYLYIVDLENYMYNTIAYPKGTDVEKDAQSFIENHVERDVFNSQKNQLDASKFTNGKRIEWQKIAEFIKTEKSNDKTDMKKYKSGHYYVAKSQGRLKLQPIGMLPNVKEGELI